MITKECEHCKKTFEAILNEHNQGFAKYCNKFCFGKAHSNKTGDIKVINCAQCNKEIVKRRCDRNASISGRSYCNKSCAATYNNTHKTKGNRRSKLEIWLEEKLKATYPTLDLLFNDKSAINSELDVYIPSLKLAFELNGIFHYEPIYGADKLSQIQNNDNRKFQACLEKGIELCIIDTSTHKYVTTKSSQKYIDIVESVVNMKLAASK